MELLIEEQEISAEQSEVQITSSWTCDACGGDSDSGCQMSDPEGCVRR